MQALELPNLEVGFPLICFQRLSLPNIATQHCPWQDQLVHQRFVLSGPLVGCNPAFLRAQTISSPAAIFEEIWAGPTYYSGLDFLLTRYSGPT